MFHLVKQNSANSSLRADVKYSLSHVGNLFMIAIMIAATIKSN